MRRTLHFHACQGCGKKTPCYGELQENWNGWPEVICAVFHEPGGGLNPAFRCDVCRDQPAARESSAPSQESEA